MTRKPTSFARPVRTKTPDPFIRNLGHDVVEAQVRFDGVGVGVPGVADRAETRHDLVDRRLRAIVVIILHHPVVWIGHAFQAVGPGPRRSGQKLTLDVSYHAGRKHLPVVRVKRAREQGGGHSPARRAARARDRGGRARVTPNFQRTARSRRGGSPQRPRPYHFDLRFSTPSWGSSPVPRRIKSPWTRTPMGKGGREREVAASASGTVDGSGTAPTGSGAPTDLP